MSYQGEMVMAMSALTALLVLLVTSIVYCGSFVLNISSNSSDGGGEIPFHLPPRDHLVPLGNIYGLGNVCNTQLLPAQAINQRKKASKSQKSAGQEQSSSSPWSDLLPDRGASTDNCGDFHVVLYYLDHRSCSGVVRRLDASSWSFNLSIFVQPSETSAKKRYYFSIGPSASASLSFIISLDHVDDRDSVAGLVLVADPRATHPLPEQSIPRVIIQTFSSRRPRSVYQGMARLTFSDLNPEYSLFMYTDRDCRAFLKRLFDVRVVEAYDSLVSPTFKADLFRYAYLAIHGGCYFDHKMISRKPLRSVILPGDTLLVCSDANPVTGQGIASLKQTQRFYNAVICSQRQDPRIWLALYKVLRNIETRISAGSDLSLTGPIAFYRAIANNVTENELRFMHGFTVSGSSTRRFHRKYEDYFVKVNLPGAEDTVFLTKNYRDFNPDPRSRYGYLWQRNIVYFDLIGRFEPWKVYMHTRQSACVTLGGFDPLLESIQLLPSSRLVDDNSTEHRKNCADLLLHIVNDATHEVRNLNIPFYRPL